MENLETSETNQKIPHSIKFLVFLAIFLGIIIIFLFYHITTYKKPVMVSNPSFEDCFSGWSVVAGNANESATCVEGIAYHGNKSIRIDFKNTSWIVIPHHFGVGDLRLEPKKRYVVEFYVMSLNMTKICVGYDEYSPSDSFLQWYSCPGGVISFPADGKWHKVVHKFNTNKLSESNYGVFKFDISGCDKNHPEFAPYCEGELNNPGTLWIDGPVKLWIVY